MNLAIILSVVAAIGCGVVSSSTETADVKALAPVAANTPTAVTSQQTAVFAGGCFWGVEAVFESLKGVSDVRSGYVGGSAKTANYDEVSEGTTEHAEAIIVTYDPAKISYLQLLAVFFSVAHDPTELNRQGPDVGRQYRSAIFYIDAEQKKLSQDYLASIDKSKVWKKPVVTQVVPLEKFYEAEKYHQNYLVQNPTQPYIVAHDLPKLEALKAKFPELYKEK